MLEVVHSNRIQQVELAELACKSALDAGLSETDLRLYGKRASLGWLASALSKRKSFHIEASTFDAHLTVITDYRLGLFMVNGLNTRQENALATAVIQVEPPVSIRWVDRKYDHWQNAEEPLVYRAASRSVAGLPMKSNGLPFPLEQQIVDTSQNPGRRVLREGYVEAIGHRMWLGPEYFLRVPGADQATIVNAAWLQVTEMQDGILEIVAADEPFVDNSTADIQNRLRKLLFPATA